MKTNWGILACGKIARKFASDLRKVDGAVLHAVASTSMERATSFEADFPAQHVLGSYEELVNLPDLDVVYIASPHSHHHEHTLLCLNHGKAVLCEKAFAINSRQASEMIDLARSKKVFLMEALWTRFLPHYQKIQEMIAEGLLGELKGVTANFGFKPVEPVAPRLFDPSLGGGALLDIGIYPVFLAQSLLGIPDSIQASMNPSASGVDEQCSISFHYNNGRSANLFASLASNLETDADVFGTKGRIRLTSRFYEPSATINYYPGIVDTRTLVGLDREAGFGYQFEARHVQECLKSGKTESPVWSLDDTLNLMKTLDRIRLAMGLKYDVDK
ncbi:MAG: Gfo/Idh/MocA family protein [Chitinophagaceae bacterium]|jgi:predicted dehydrogenase